MRLASSRPLVRDASQGVGRTTDSESAAIQDMSIDHRRPNIAMPKELLHRADIIARRKEVSGERVPERVTGRQLGDATRLNGISEGALHGALVQMMPTVMPRRTMNVQAARGKDPLPLPLTPGVGVFADEGVRQLDPTRANSHVRIVLTLDPLQVLVQRGPHPRREHGDAVSVPLPRADPNLTPLEVEILDAEAERFEKAKTTAIEECRHKADGTL